MVTGRIDARTLGAALALWACLVATAVADSQAAAKARAALDRGDLRAATIELKSALQKNPNDAAVRLELGRLYLRIGNGEAAEKEIRSAIELGAPASDWRLDFVEALIRQGKFDDAVQRLDAATELPEAEQARALVLRGDAAFGQGKVDVARSRYEEAQAVAPDNEGAALGLLRIAVKDADPAASAKAADAFLERFPNNTEATLVRAELHRAAGENDRALVLYDRALARNPQNIIVRLGRATALIGQKQLDDAVKELDAVDQLQKDTPMTIYLRGVVEFQKKNWKQAGEHLDRVLAAVPGHPQSQLLLGIIRYSEGELETADGYLSNVIKATPENLQARKVLAAARIKLREPARAIEVLEPVAQSGDPQTMALLGSAYMLQGDLERGQEFLNRAVEAAPDVAALRTQLALTLLAGGQTSKAINELQSAVDLGQDILQADVLLVLAHLKNKEFDQALEASKRLEQRKPTSPIPYNLTGLAFMAKGDLTSARQRFEKALEVDPAFVTAEINMARLDVAAKDLDAAQRRYEHVIKSNPKHLGALLGLAALAELRKDNVGLEAALERAKDANPTASQPGLLLTRYYITRGDYLKALTLANELATRFPNDEATLQMLARAQTLGGQVPNAIRTFDQLIAKNPQNAQLHYLAGGARWKGQDYSGAQTAFRRALELKPDFVDARVALASVALDGGDTATAMETAKSLQKDFPKAAVGYRVEGSVHSAKRDFKSAAAALKQAYAREKDGAIARQLADAMNQTGDIQGAVGILEGWAEDNPKDLDAQTMLGLFLQQVGRPKDAVAVYERVVKDSDQKNAPLLNNLAWLYHEQGDPRALATAKEAYDLAPTRPEIADTYGWVLFQSGKKEEGLAILQQAYLAYPSQSEIGYHVAVALESLKRNDEAIQILRKVLRDNPKSQQAPDATALLKKLGGA